MKRSKMHALLLILTSLIGLSSYSYSNELLRNFNDWSAFVGKTSGTTFCYLGSEAQKSEGKYTKRGNVLFLVTHRPTKKSVAVINFRAGYKFKKNSRALITIAKKKFKLFTESDNGWAKDSKSDVAIIKAMKQGSIMIIEGTSSRGTKTKDIFSLRGFTAAYNAASKACRMKK